ncbi:MAG: BMP family ABC transporter substrate-binding protein, partial [Armatimonadota bacterium]|nr:BMP family ABC transporter substrate-binding protein [Armatimonadota bacterium]
MKSRPGLLALVTVVVILLLQTSAPTPAPAAARVFKIAVVSDVGGRGDLSFNDMAFKGGEDAERDFGVRMVELVSKVEADYVPNLTTAARDPDVQLVVGVGFLLSDALAQVAQRFPNKNFMGIDTFSQSIVKDKFPARYPLPNLMDIVYEEHKG